MNKLNITDISKQFSHDSINSGKTPSTAITMTGSLDVTTFDDLSNFFNFIKFIMGTFIG